MIQKKYTLNKKVFLLLKNNELNWIPPSSQTANMRNLINEKIKILGPKYYQVKNLFEMLKLNRDFIFDVGKQLVNDYKEEKNGLCIMSQQKRMKEGLYVWYTENFYEEIFNPNSTFLSTYLVKQNGQAKLNFIIFNQLNIKSNILPKIVKETQVIPNNSIKNQPKSFDNQAIFNKEIDDFNFGNFSNDQDKESTTNKSGNFDYSGLLNFEM